MTNILIVEDHQSMCDAIKTAFTKSNRYIITGCSPSAEFSLLFCEKLQPDLILMDICTEGNSSGLLATENIKKKFPKIKIIIMTGFDELTYIKRAKKAGADGFIYKTSSLDFFVKVADEIMAGGSYFPQAKSIPVATGEMPLSEREMEVLRLMCKHMTNKEIAEQLFITENTVKFHKKNMLCKTGFKTSMDLVFFMISNGYINPLF